MPIHVPMVAVHTVGAGGGSIARVDAAGPDPGRPGKRRRQSRPDLLRPRRHGADHHRRQSGARPARPEKAAGGRQSGHRRARRAASSRTRSASAAGLDGVAAAGAVLQARQHEDGRRDPHGFGGARPRPARFRAVRLRRRRAAACHRAGARTRPAEGAGAGAARHHQCARLRRRRSAPRLRQHDQPAGGAAR